MQMEEHHNWKEKKQHFFFFFFRTHPVGQPAFILYKYIHLKLEIALAIPASGDWKILKTINPLTAKLFILNFRAFEVVSRWRDPQVSENHSDLKKSGG